MSNVPEWQNFIDQLKKDKNPLYELLQETEVVVGQELIIYHPTEEGKVEIKKKHSKIQAKLEKSNHPFQGKRVVTEAGKPQIVSETVSPIQSRSSTKITTPLQALNQSNIYLADEKSTQDTLKTVASNDKTCESIYQHLTRRTRRMSNHVLEVKFPWRVRVGGMRGFQELLLPVFHPVYGIPYIPSSSLKGATRAWAKQHGVTTVEIDRLFGKLDSGVGCVQILDAFPTGSCLSVDMANPQWHWESDRVRYNPEPHPLLSMKEPTFVIGLRQTSRGKKVGKPDDLEMVKGWLENALAVGIGSRVSAGYGRTKVKASLPEHSSHEFKMWTQGMYGADTRNAEFRHTALRGVLRYWFRAVALGLYDAQTCQVFEKDLFGELSSEGSVRIGVDLKPQRNNRNGRNQPYLYEGTILLESKCVQHLELIDKLLCLISHISGIGRGSRRPLHLLRLDKPVMTILRGCHWELKDNKLPCNKESWKKFLQSIKDSFTAIRSAGNPGNGSPGNLSNRYQDVLNSNAKIFLVPSTGQIHPETVPNWNQDGDKKNVRGSALNLLYSRVEFKGAKCDRQGRVIQNTGNPLVGGKLETPSFVIIQSNFPDAENPYQAVTIFGADNSDRDWFVKNLPSDSIPVWH